MVDFVQIIIFCLVFIFLSIFLFSNYRFVFKSFIANTSKIGKSDNALYQFKMFVLHSFLVVCIPLGSLLTYGIFFKTSNFNNYFFYQRVKAVKIEQDVNSALLRAIMDVVEVNKKIAKSHASKTSKEKAYAKLARYYLIYNLPVLALDNYLAALEQNENNIEYKFGVIYALIAKGSVTNIVLAKEITQELILETKDNPHVYELAGRVALLSGDNKNARGFLQKALTLYQSENNIKNKNNISKIVTLLFELEKNET